MEAAEVVEVVEIAGVFHIVAAVREQIPVQVNEIIVGHAGDIVHNDLVGFGLFVGHLPGIVGLVYIIYVMAEDGGVGLALGQVIQQLLVNFLHHGLCHPVQDHPARFRGIDHGVVVPLVGLDRLEMGLVQHDIILAVAVFDDVDHQIVDDLRIDGADDGRGEGTAFDHLDAGRILPVLAQIGDDIGNTHHVAFQSGGLDLAGIAGGGVALFQLRFKFLETAQRHRTVL